MSAWYVFATVVVFTAIFMGAARLLLPHLGEYKEEISSAVSNYINQPVEVESLNAEWHGFGPSLVLEKIVLQSADKSRPVLELEKARLDFNLVASLVFLQPTLSNITLVGSDLVLTREKDGRLSFVGIEGGNKTEGLDVVTKWIFSQGKLRLEKSNVTWRDRMGDGEKLIHFTSIDATLKNSGSRHVLDASTDLPKSLGKSLTVHVDLRGDLLDPVGRRANAYFRGEKLQLTDFLESQSIADVSARVGEADFQVWLEWKDGALQELKGEVDVDNVSLFPVAEEKNTPVKKDGHPLGMELKRLAGTFGWSKSKTGWRFDANDLVLSHGDHRWLPARVSVSAEQDDQSVSSVKAFASHMLLEDAAQILQLFSIGGEKLQAPLASIQPRGMVHDARMTWRGGEEPGYKAYARLDGATTNSWKFIPATRDIDGQIWLDNKTGQAVLDRGSAVLNFPGLFRWPIDVNEMRGQVDWRIDGDRWQLVSHELVAKNADISASASFSFVKDSNDKKPFMSLVAKFENGDGSQVAHYLPTGIMHDTTVEWLDTAILAGHVVSGGTIMHGRLSDFPFDRGDGKFEVRFDVENGRLDYAKGWPSISDINAEVQFAGRSMLINASRGKIFSNEIQWARVELPDMTAMPLPLLINGDIKGVTQDKLDYLVKSPALYDAVGQYLEGMTTEGSSLLRLDLKIPIGKYEDAAVNGWVDLDSNSLAMPAVGRVLSDVKGRLHFSQDSLEMDAEQASLLGQPTDLKVSSGKKRTGNWANIRANGKFGAKSLAKLYMPTLVNSVDGEGELKVAFDIPLGKHNGRNRIATLDVASNFQGVEMNLPAPFAKAADEAIALNLKVDFPPGSDPVMSAKYGDMINAVFTLNNNVVAGIKNGEVRINGGEVSLPGDNGLRVIGWLDNVSLNDWLDLWPAKTSSPVDRKASLTLFHSIDMGIGKLEAYGQEIHNVRVVSLPVDDAWHVDISSDEVVGQAQIPASLSVYPVSGKFGHLYLSEPTMAGGGLDPRDLPSLNLSVDDFRYKTLKLGSIQLETTRLANGVRMEQVIIKPMETNIIARGSWVISGEQHSSMIQANVESTDVGKTLKELGYVGAVGGGEGEASLQLKWPSALYDVDVNHLSGDMQLSLKKGQLLDIDPGAGRLFGMLSLQALPRRLFLDFSDVFSKGFSFDEIKGKFTIQDGNAYTKKLRLDGPAAKIEIKGRTGLAEKDYDQLVTVTPSVGDSLPVIGALTATPQIGAVILFVQKLFQPDIEEATKFQYTITGNWNDPVITKVKTPKNNTRQNEDNSLVTDE
ncbi:YhdP family protein [Kaarinaea lacus]